MYTAGMWMYKNGGGDVIQSKIINLLRERDVAFISVGHRPTLKAFHDTVLEITGDHDWRLMPATSYDFGRS